MKFAVAVLIGAVAATKIEEFSTIAPHSYIETNSIQTTSSKNLSPSPPTLMMRLSRPPPMLDSILSQLPTMVPTSTRDRSLQCSPKIPTISS